MKRREVIRIANDVFGSEPTIRRLEAAFRAEDSDVPAIDLTFMVEGDLYEGESKVIPLVMDYMERLPDSVIEFLVLPVYAGLERHGEVLIDREEQSEPLGPRAARR